jgi:Radial spokehead-like protein
VASRAAVSVSFWGKIFGTKRDYYVIEADVEPGDQEEILERHEPKKQPGINKKMYFVTNDRKLPLSSYGP